MTGGKTYQQNGLKAAAMRAIEEAARDASLITTRCALCPWTYEGTALEGRELAKGHRRVHHPDLKVTRRRRNSLKVSATDTEFRREGLERAADIAAMHVRRER